MSQNLTHNARLHVMIFLEFECPADKYAASSAAVFFKLLLFFSCSNYYFFVCLLLQYAYPKQIMMKGAGR